MQLISMAADNRAAHFVTWDLIMVVFLWGWYLVVFKNGVWCESLLFRGQRSSARQSKHALLVECFYYCPTNVNLSAVRMKLLEAAFLPVTVMTMVWVPAVK